MRLGHNLGLDVIAESVENKSQLQALLRMGCTRFQGFLFSRPVTLQEFELLVLADGQRGALASGASGECSLAPA